MKTFLSTLRVLLSLALISLSKSWEIPSFLLDGLPLIEQSGIAERKLVNTTNDPVFNDQGTASPTESPAPSPSPSEGPTIAPTITAAPSSEPTAAPTESPAPSPSPSETPTEAPTGAPSIPPSEYPTISSPPSLMPSIEPSDRPTTMPSISPSSSPTISSPPSLSPSQEPSDQPTTIPSQFPSASPTLIAEVTAEFSIKLGIESGELGAEQIGAFQNATEGFLQNDVSIEDGKIHDISVQVTGQLVIDISDENSTSSNFTRRLFNTLSLEQQLLVSYSVSALYSGSNNLFDLQAELDPHFQDIQSQWFKRLSAADDVFLPLSPESDPDGEPGSIESESSPSAGGGVSSGTVAVVSLLAIAALAVGIAASVFSIRHFRQNAYGQELNSPRVNGEGLGSFIVNQNDEYQVSQDDIGARSDFLLAKSASGDGSEGASSWIKPPATPNSLEMGASIPIDKIMQSKPRSFEKVDDSWIHIQPSKSESRKDPPTASSEINVPNKKFQDPKRLDPRSMNSLFDTNTEISEMTRSHLALQEMSHEIMLTKSMGGTLGATSVAASMAESGFTNSDFSDHGKSFFGVGTKDTKQNDHNGQNEVAFTTAASSGTFDHTSTRGGLYDVFAPPGPIGIVVDTTKDGPAVHSLKRTSPMLGLINPGDLIVALDDIDARGMTAATLTQLMAKKSSQKERKITLQTVDNL